MRISATIVTLNEEHDIARAIESLRCVDEIVVVDSGSTDRTCEIARDLNARVIQEAWKGYAGQKNLAAARASNDWILSIDADEALGEELDSEILQLKGEGPRFDGYSMPRFAQYLGRWILHGGWYPDRKVRLYRRDRGSWTGDYVHETVTLQGTVGHLQGNLLHFTCDSLSDHLRSLDRYTTLAAQEIAARNTRISMRHLSIDPCWAFIRSYVIQRGFLDGPQGLAIAWMAALYVFLKYAKARDTLDESSSPRQRSRNAGRPVASVVPAPGAHQGGAQLDASRAGESAADRARKE